MCESGAIVLTLPTEDDTRRLGAVLAAGVSSAGTAVVITLDGELGAGKTTLVSGFLRAMGWTGPVRSPTYTLIEPYDLERRVFHIDLYRLSDPSEVEALALRDLLDADAVLLIEWPSRGAGLLPSVDVTLSLTYGGAAASEAGRRLAVRALTPGGKEVVAHIFAVKHQQ